jgi:hypothetical protein
MNFIIWKTRHKTDNRKDSFSYTLKRENCFPLLLSAEQFEMLFPDVNAWAVPEAPETGTLNVPQGTLIL